MKCQTKEELRKRIVSELFEMQQGDLSKVVSYITDNFLHFDTIEDLIQQSTSHLCLSIGLSVKMNKCNEISD